MDLLINSETKELWIGEKLLIVCTYSFPKNFLLTVKVDEIPAFENSVLSLSGGNPKYSVEF